MILYSLVLVVLMVVIGTRIPLRLEASHCIGPAADRCLSRRASTVAVIVPVAVQGQRGGRLPMGDQGRFLVRGVVVRIVAHLGDRYCRLHAGGGVG